MPKADVQLQSVDRGTVATATTNNAGIYVFPSVQPGQFQMTVRKQGFKQVDLLGIIINTQDHIEQNFRLQLGSVSESVTVRADQNNIDTTDGTVSTTIDRNFAENLPLNGRSFQTLILLTPGTALTEGSPLNGGTFSVNGQRGNANSFTVDGVSANVGGYTSGIQAEYSLNGSNPGFTILGTTQGMVSVDALQEFKIQTSTYAPEFGRQPGGQVSLLTRSGNNDFHGTAFDYLRNTDFDANNWFNDEAGLPKGVDRQNDFGGTFGGPILKDRTFFFFSYEGLRLLTPVTSTPTVPDQCLRGTQTCPSGESAAAAVFQPILQSFPLPTGPAFTVACSSATDPLCPPSGREPTGGAPFLLSESLPTNLNSYNIKIDHVVRGNLRFFGRYGDTTSQASALLGPNGVGDDRLRSRSVTLGADASVRPNLVNELRLNYTVNNSSSVDSLQVLGGAKSFDLSSLFPSPLVYGQDASVILILLPHSLFDLAVGPTGIFPQRQIDVVDNVSHSMGTHQLKWGVDYRRLFPTIDSTSFAQLRVLSGTNPVLGASNDLLSGIVTQARGSDYLVAHPIFVNLSLYAQDSWALSRRLTLTYGLRWDLNPPPGERDGIQPLNVVGLNDPATATLAPANSKLYRTTYNNFAPRIGLAYQLTQSPGHESVIRGGFGVFYDLNSEQDTNGFLGAPFQNFSASGNVPFPVPAGTISLPPIPAPLSPPYPQIDAIDPNLKLPYTLQWNVSIQQGLGPNQSMTASYVASAGYRLLRGDLLYDFNPNFTAVQEIRNASSSNYQSLQLQFNRSLAQGLQVLASYTYSHSIDNASSSAASLSTLPSGSGFVNPNIDRGNSDFDLRHAFRAALNYNIPNPNSNFLSKAVLSGWSVDIIAIAQTALPVDLMGGDYSPIQIPDGFLQLRPNVVPGQPLYLYGAQCASAFQASGALSPGEPCPGGRAFNPNAFTPVPTDPATGNPTQLQGNLSRNYMRGLGLWQVDFALHRQFDVTERVKLQFRSEFFNFFNHPNFGNIDGFVGDSTFGLAQSTLNNFTGGLNPLYQPGGPRSIQLALKLVF